MAEAMTGVWQEVQGHLRAFIAKRVADRAEAEDILQDVFLRMHQRIESLKDPRRIVSWLYQIARRAIIDHYRKPRRRRELPVGLASNVETAGVAPHVPSGFRTADQAELRAELSGCLRPMIERLAHDYREAVRLVELEGLTQQAAARQMGLSLPGMKSRVQRGRKQLKRMLEDCCLIQLDRRGGVMDYEVREGACDPCGGSRR